MITVISYFNTIFQELVVFLRDKCVIKIKNLAHKTTIGSICTIGRTTDW